jgi:hypothetical protein
MAERKVSLPEHAPPVEKVLMGCAVLEPYLTPLLGDATPAIFFDLGLHDQPSLMRPALQEQLDALPEPATVLIGYGLCGNGVVGLEAGSHTLILPKAHDCIGMAYGSNEAHSAAVLANPGTYYVTKGWIGTGNDPLEQYESYVEQYGPDRADRIVNAFYRAYDRVCLMAFSEEELAEVRPLAAPIVQFFQDRWQLEYVEKIGDPSFIEGLVTGDRKQHADFVIVEPGGTVAMEMFF